MNMIMYAQHSSNACIVGMITYHSLGPTSPHSTAIAKLGLSALQKAPCPEHLDKLVSFPMHLYPNAIYELTAAEKP